MIFPPEYAIGVFLKLKTSSSNGLFSILLLELEAMIKFNKIRKGEVLHERFVDKEK